MVLALLRPECQLNHYHGHLAPRSSYAETLTRGYVATDTNVDEIMWRG